MLSNPRTAMRISGRLEPGRTDRAVLHILSPALRGSPDMTARLEERYGRVLTGLSRQLRAPLDPDPATGDYAIVITVLEYALGSWGWAAIPRPAPSFRRHSLKLGFCTTLFHVTPP